MTPVGAARRRAWLLAGLGAVACAGALASRGGPWSGLGRGDGEVPSVVLRRERFERRVTAEGLLRAVKSTPVTTPLVVDLDGPFKIAWLLPDGSPVQRGDVVVRFDPSELEKKQRDSQSDRETASARIAREQTDAAAAVRGRARAAALSQVELEKTRAFPRKDPEIFSRHQIIEAQIDEALSTARKGHADEARRLEQSLSRSKLDLLGLDRKKAERQLELAQKGLRSLSVAAPHDGVLVYETDWRGNTFKVGDTVWPSQRLASLPLLDQMEVEAFVLEADAGGLAKDQPAQVVIEAHPETVYQARVARVDTLARPRQREVPVNYFVVTLALLRTERQHMKPGQRVRATLILDQEGVLTVPRQAVCEREGRKVVFRQAGGRFEAVPVTLGASSPGRVVITAGLREGDRVALDDPARPAPEAAREGGPAGAPGPGLSGSAKGGR